MSTLHIILHSIRHNPTKWFSKNQHCYIYIYIYKAEALRINQVIRIQNYIWVSSRGVLDCDTTVTEFEPRLYDSLGQGMNSLTTQCMDQLTLLLSFFRYGFGIIWPMKIDMPLNPTWYGYNFLYDSEIKMDTNGYKKFWLSAGGIGILEPFGFVWDTDWINLYRSRVRSTQYWGLPISGENLIRLNSKRDSSKWIKCNLDKWRCDNQETCLFLFCFVFFNFFIILFLFISWKQG